ncbi:glucose 1-dehydrogenase [Ophiocordyceps camponoti-floridani]|uniref:Glucose 1-dehydrogenase n=1 Tax=Ophiocordyceps camponoti-floridani TaxID=2030778 RepID=A0A8H4QD52_9HYPO|nr:glucose 1-dehydrogenase [Ophiocordyceps camponoti-floridani]
MALLLAGKTAIITGGTTGIGRAICLEYLRRGASVVVNHLGDEGGRRHAESLAEEAARSSSSSSSPGHLVLEAGDVRDPATATRLVDRAVALSGPQRRLDVCVSNAGVCTFADLLSVSPTLLDETIRTNLDGAFFITQAAARQMAQAQTPPGGSIIGVSSVSALVGGSRQTHYTPTKAGVLSLMQSAAAALGSHGIRCNALLPGTIRTRLNDEDLANGEKRRYMERRIPLGRIAATLLARSCLSMAACLLICSNDADPIYRPLLSLHARTTYPT